MTTNSAAAAFGGAPAAAPAAAPVAAPAAPAAAPAAPASNDGTWYSSIPDEGVRNWAAAKGWKDPAAVVESAYNLEKLIGFDRAGRTLVVPKDDAPPEEWAKFSKALGVPETPDGYKLPVPEGDTGEFAKVAAQMMHKAGIPPREATALAAQWNDYMTQQASQAQAQQAQAADREFGEVVASWGPEAEANLELGKRAAAQFIPAANAQERQQLLSKIEGAVGTATMLKMFAAIGKGLGEHKVVDAGGGASFGMSPAEANAKIQSLKGDREWVAKYLSGDRAKIDEMQRLIVLANPAQA